MILTLVLAYWYKNYDWYKIGIHIHLICVIPACILVFFQFIPIIRHKLLLIHRINGYLVTLLLITGNLGAMMIARRAFGGTLATQTCVGAMAISTTISSILAYINIKRLQIEQHRAWMLRTWAIAGCIITERLIQITAAQIISMIGSYYIAMRCDQIQGSGGNISRYPTCAPGQVGFAVVHADYVNPRGIEEVAAAFQLSFGMSLWLAFLMHIVGMEIYLHLTKAETERLRRVSYERQVARGMRPAGRAGITSDRLGDEEEWKPPVKKELMALPVESTTPEEVKLTVPEMESGSDLSRPPSTLGWNRV